jgi:DNA-binding IclR family transcriptional regulator
VSQTVERALTALTALGGGPCSLDDVAGELGVHKSTALRLLRTLEEHGFARHDERHRYRLGPRLLTLAQQALEDFDVRRAAAGPLAAFNARHGHTVHLAAHLDGSVVYIDKWESRHPVRMGSRIGSTAPAHCTAVGKVLLAALPPARRRAAVERLDLTARTPRTLTDPEALLAELDLVAERGWAEDRAENEPWINCVAAPIRDASGAVPAAASVSAPEPVLDAAGVLALLPGLLDAAAEAAAELGWPRPAAR